jgi:hypothetical protein
MDQKIAFVYFDHVFDAVVHDNLGWFVLPVNGEDRSVQVVGVHVTENYAPGARVLEDYDFPVLQAIG